MRKQPPHAVIETVRALNRKGNELQCSGRPKEAVAVFQRALALAPHLAAVWGNLGSAWMLCGRPSDAVLAYRQALSLAAHDDGLRVRLVLALLAQMEEGHADAASLTLARTLLSEIRTPVNESLAPLVWLAQARILLGLDSDRGGAQQICTRLLRQEPDWVPALLTAAQIAEAMSRPEDACALLRRATRVAPDDADALARYIYTLQRDPHGTPGELFEATLRHARLLRRNVVAVPPIQPAPSGPERRLVLGFVSGDFRQHPSGYLVEGLFRALPRERVRVIAYSNHAAQDAQTEVLRALVDDWRAIHDLDTAQVCERVRVDQVDVLIDLSGLTRHHRLDLFAVRAAPLQVSWLGYHTGTGLDTMDAHLTDREMSRGLQPFYRERLVDLPWAFNQPAGSLPEVTPLLARAPYERNGHITFGSLNNPSKCNDAVFDAWAEILRRVPDARLVQRYRLFADRSVAAEFRARFAARGIAEERIDCLPGLKQREALEWLAGSVDIGLDPFPFGSHTTGLQSLAVGVPLVSMYGRQLVERVSAVFHLRLRLPEFVARDPVDYIERAVAIARSPQGLAQRRREYRARTMASPLTDESAFAENFERVVRALWQENIDLSLP